MNTDFLKEIQLAAGAGRLENAAEILSQAAKNLVKTTNLTPDEIYLWEKFGIHLLSMGEFEKLTDLLAKMTTLHPFDPQLHSYMLFTLHHLPGIEQDTIFRQHQTWAALHAPINRMETHHTNTPAPAKKLRIAYISPDFRTHAVALFAGPLIAAHDRQNFEVFGYGNIAKPDRTTEYFKGKFDCYRDVFGIAPEPLAKLIKDDRIDILIDLAGHTAGSSLLALAYKPAPIQISYLGYPGSTGMRQIDYRMTDEIVNPPQSQKYYTEKLLYLPHPFCCFEASDLPTAPLPAQRNGFITFASFQNNCKINSQCLALWSAVLKSLDNSRIMLRFAQAENPAIREFYFNEFEKLGITRSRVDIAAYLPYPEHLKKYQQADIALDTFPFNGHTTICEALSMGVPAISLTGETFASRLGLCMSKAVGLDFFAAGTKDEYIKKAISLAQNLPSLIKIREGMRQRIKVSPLFNPKTFAAGVEDTYRQIWHNWCNSHQKTD